MPSPRGDDRSRLRKLGACANLEPSVRESTGRHRGVPFLSEVITLAVRWYLRDGLSYCDVEELLAERGIAVVTSRCIGGCSGRRRPPTPRHVTGERCVRLDQPAERGAIALAGGIQQLGIGGCGPGKHTRHADT